MDAPGLRRQTQARTCAEVECDPDCPNNPDAPQCPGCGKPEALCIYETPGCASEDDDPTPTERPSTGADPADTMRDEQIESMRFKR